MRAQQRAGDGGVGVRVAAATHGLHQRFLEVEGVQAPEGILQRDQYPSLMREVVRGGGALRRTPHRVVRRTFGVRHRRLEHLVAARAGDARGDGGAVGGAGLEACRIRMREHGIVARGAGGERRIAGSPDADRRAAHERAVGFALGGDEAEQPALGGHADIDRARSKPGAVAIEHLLAVVLLLAHDAAGERERHLAVVGRLAGHRVVEAAVAELAQALRMVLGDFDRGLALHARTETVAHDLPQQAADRARQATGIVGTRKGQADAGLAPRLGVEARPVECRQLLCRLRAAGEAAGEAPLRIAGEHDLVALRVEQHAACRAHERHAGRHVVFVHAVHRDCGEAIAGGYTGKPVGDARHGDVTCRRDRLRPGHGLERRRRRRPHHASRLELAGPQIDRHGCAVTANGTGALRPSDGVRSAIRGIRRVHHAEHGPSLLEKRHRDRRAAPARRVFEGAIVRIDQPHPAFARAGRDGALLAAELRRDERLERDLQTLLDLAVERAAAGPAARTLRPIELLAQPRALGLDRGDDFRENVLHELH